MSNEVAAKTSWTKILIIACGTAVAVGLILLAFAWPSVTAKVQKVPIAVVGNSAQVQQLIEQAPADALSVQTLQSREEILTAIKHRDVYGGIVLSQSPEILTSSAASPVTSQMLSGMATQMQLEIDKQVQSGMQNALAQLKKAALNPQAANPQGTQNSAPNPSQAPAQNTPAQNTPAQASIPKVKVTDVVPLSSDDPRGTGLAVAGLPLTLGGTIGGMLVSLNVVGAWRRVGAVVAYGAFTGFGLAAILQGWLHILQGDYFANAAVIGLGIAATAALISGLHSLIGRAGLAVGAIITVLIGNPLSSLTQPKEFLIGNWGEIGQWFVPGASGTLLRDLSYFPDAAQTLPWLILAGWLIVGLALTALGHANLGSAKRPEHRADPAIVDTPATASAV